MSSKTSAKSADPKSNGTTKTPFRRDIQGLRAVAVLLVVLNHAGVPGLEGGYVGVDVFFVISGFVITQSLLSSENRQGISIRSFYAARARRILPLSTLVIVATAVSSLFLLNYIRAEQVAQDALAATFFLANFHFSAQGTDYFSSDVPPSPFQHFWSLAVEEQFYLVWPWLLGILVFGFTRKSTGPFHKVPSNRVLAILGLLIVVSFGWSVIQTAELATVAYFSPLTRAWELAAGATLAVGAVHLSKLPWKLLAAGSWVGLAGVLGSAFLLDEKTSFPGYAVALPVLSTILIIAGGTASYKNSGAGLVLELAPFRAIGNWSFSIYLWHWPILVIAAGYLGRDMTLPENLAVIALSVAISYVTYTFIERPSQRSTWLKNDREKSLALWPAALAITLCSLLFVNESLQGWESDRAAAAAMAAPASTPLADSDATDPAADAVRESVRAAANGVTLPIALTPAVDEIGDDVDELAGCSAASGDTESEVCAYGDPDAGRSIAVIGDSHALHWIPAFDLIGKSSGWTIFPVVKHGCTASDVTLMYSNGAPNTECDVWRAWAYEKVDSLGVDTVIISTSIPGSIAGESGVGLTDSDIDAMSRLWADGVAASATRLGATGAEVVVLSDAPGVQEAPAECLLARDATMSTCTWPQSQRSIILNDATRAGASAAGVDHMDLTPWFCDSKSCPLVIGTTIAYRDKSHVSTTYAAQLAEPLSDRLGLRD
jgi:peptidoglycan/LPS O-acetylase OafA/YrhL